LLPEKELLPMETTDSGRSNVSSLSQPENAPSSIYETSSPILISSSLE